MTLKLDEVKQAGIDFGRVEDGTYPARIVQVIDLGIQPQTHHKTHEILPSKPVVMITWEFPTSRVEFENDEGTTSLPRWVSKEYTISRSDKSNLMKLVNALAPKAKDISELINLPCMVQIGSTSGGNAKVINVLPPMSGIEIADLENDTSYFDFDHPEQELFDTLKKWQQRRVREADNYEGFADTWGELEEEVNSDY